MAERRAVPTAEKKARVPQPVALTSTFAALSTLARMQTLGSEEEQKPRRSRRKVRPRSGRDRAPVR